MKIYFNGFWKGFIENTDCNNMDTFLKLFRKVFGCECSAGTFTESDVLCESIFGQPLVKARQWKYTFLFSGESRLNEFKDSYTIVLWGERNHDNVINFPLFVSYLQYRDRWLMLSKGNEDSLPPRRVMPSNDILALISNGNSNYRNVILNKLEASGLKITYAGKYRNNIGYSLDYDYYSDEQIRFMNGFKFVLAFENHRQETYITEKIVNPLLAQTIPIYYGSEHINNYFNKDRILNIKDDSDENILMIIEKIHWLCENPTEWLKIVNAEVFTENNTKRTLKEIALDIKNKLYSSEDHMANIDRIYCLASPEFELSRYNTLKKVFSKWGIDDSRVKYICPTWKHHITQDVMEKYIKSPKYIHNLREIPMRPSEISLYLNNIAAYTHIKNNYSDGIFLVLESDIIDGEYFELLPDLMKILKSNHDKWDVIFAGSFDKNCMPYAKNFYKSVENPIEDMTDENSFIRIKRGVEWRTTEAYIWKYESIVKFLNYIENNLDFKVPYDHYLEGFFKESSDLKICWIHSPMFFYQTSIHKTFGSTIQ